MFDSRHVLDKIPFVTNNSRVSHAYKVRTDSLREAKLWTRIYPPQVRQKFGGNLTINYCKLTFQYTNFLTRIGLLLSSKQSDLLDMDALFII